MLEYIDIPLHVIGGAIAGITYILAIAMTIPRETLSRTPRWHLMLSTFSFVSLVAVAWEFFELFTDTFLHTGLQASIAETLKDIAVGLLGGFTSLFCWPTKGAWKEK